MNAEQVMFLFPQGFPLVPPGVVHGNPNPIVQAYLSDWRSGKISIEAAYCGIIHCLMSQVDQLEGFIAASPLKVPEPTLVGTDETKNDQENPCQPVCNKEEQQASPDSKEGTGPNDQAG